MVKQHLFPYLLISSHLAAVKIIASSIILAQSFVLQLFFIFADLCFLNLCCNSSRILKQWYSLQESRRILPLGPMCLAMWPNLVKLLRYGVLHMVTRNQFVEFIMRVPWLTSVKAFMLFDTSQQQIKEHMPVIALMLRLQWRSMLPFIFTVSYGAVLHFFRYAFLIYTNFYLEISAWLLIDQKLEI